MGDDAVGAALLRREGDDPLGVAVCRERGCVDGRVHRLPLPLAAGLVLDECIDPLAAVDHDRQVAARRPLAGPVHSHHVHRHLPARLAHVLLRGQPDVELASVDDDLAPPGDGLPVRAGDGRLDGQLLPAGHHVAGQVDGQVAVTVGLPRAADDDLGNGRFPPPAPDPGIVLVGKIVAAKLGRLEAVGGGKDVPLDARPGHRPAEKVTHLGFGPSGLPGQQFSLIRRDRDLELGRAVGGDGETGGRIFVVKDDVNDVFAQRSALRQQQFAVESAELVQFQPFLVDLLAGGVVDGDLSLAAGGDGVMHVLLEAQDAAQVDGLAGPVDGPVGVEIGAVVGAIPGIQAKIPGADAGAPIPAGSGQEERLLPHDVGRAIAIRQVEPGQAVRVRGGRGENVAVVIAGGQR